MGRVVSVPTTNLCHCNRKATMDNMYACGYGCIPIKLPCDLYINMAGRKVLFPLGKCDPEEASPGEEEGE